MTTIYDKVLNSGAILARCLGAVPMGVSDYLLAREEYNNSFGMEERVKEFPERFIILDGTLKRKKPDLSKFLSFYFRDIFAGDGISPIFKNYAGQYADWNLLERIDLKREVS
ncbi:MAG: hypothetical protein KKF68_02720 [Nanoarchaeota archaeon]|nr:hypothetical protein [Nanoarchaeota archaeon]